MKIPNITDSDWHLETSTNDYCGHSIIGSGRVVAETVTEDATEVTPEEKANAQFIVAAPEALQLLDVLYEEAKSADERDDVEDLMSIVQLIIKKAPTILKRAGYTEETSCPLSRKDIEQNQRCDWFDRPCPACGKDMQAFSAVAYIADYALLCQTPDCKNYKRAAFLDDQMSEFTEEQFETLRAEGWPNIEDDQFKCDVCGDIADIEDSTKLGDKYLCSECADEEGLTPCSACGHIKEDHQPDGKCHNGEGSGNTCACAKYEEGGET